MKKLPKLYTNTFNKKIDNSKEYIKINNNELEKIYTKDEINKKIDNIFKSTNYIYKIKVNIKTKTETLTETIIGKKGNYLITFNNKLIDITSILDIKKVD